MLFSPLPPLEGTQEAQLPPGVTTSHLIQTCAIAGHAPIMFIALQAHSHMRQTQQTEQAPLHCHFPQGMSD